ncbi:pectate lyase [Solwaraspora sp. WMMD406]|uniref:pectate lyase family protein n=1 Tax=Solwaraspora sp. WMMD406 TaxID=3016095 RepID=UPI0024174A79|nr:LamG-like jellyroll fold domain-containing protein [Solwaraspora sp. WMMD406]MDG4764702.1 pectate lyase [Solwaraspora sp. WMMD406]
MSPRTATRTLLAGGLAALVAAATLTIAGSAQAATLLADDFTDDAGPVLRQGGTSANARAVAGDPGWTDYTVAVRVKPTAFNGSDRFVAVLARVASTTSYYYLALRSSDRVELKRLVGGSSTTLASASLPVDTGTWYTLRLTVAGTTLTGQVDGGPTLTATDTRYVSGGVGVATFNASANVDDVVVSTIDPVPTPTGPPTTGPPTSPPPVAGDRPNGFASVDALGQAGTTGGTGGPVVTATNTTDFLSYIDTIGPLVIQVRGTIQISSKKGVRPNKTIVGLGDDAEITGGGLDFYRSYNVIVRNIHFTDAEDDAINVGQESHHIWIDHNTFSGAVDGSIDVVRGADYVTISWNHFDHADKSMLISHSDGAGSTDTGKLKVSIHHNFFDHSRQRHPRVRFAEPVHVYNNYFLDNELYGVASTENAGVLVEGNYFENVPFPIFSASGYADSGPGRAVQRANIFVDSGVPETTGSVVEPRTYYPYQLDPAADVPALVRAGAGAGMLG